jgi:beta-barrel assembly-enhancing protease
MVRFQSRGGPGVAATAAALMLSLGVVGAQTVITPPANRYSVSDDVEIGRQAAVEVARQLPILNDREVKGLIASMGRRLVDAIPPQFQHPEFRYSFDVINVREVNAFALPGGPIYINRGMIQAARNEGEAASVMAHELSHVALRHGTAQATKATKYEIGQVAGAVIGAIVGGRVGSAVSQGTQFGLGTAFLRFSREYERQADLLGSHIMAQAGYDPRDMASMFKTIEKTGGPGGPEWLSGHPNPGDRAEAVTREAEFLHVQNRVNDRGAFADVQARLRRMTPAPTTKEATRVAPARGAPSSPDARPVLGRVAAPSKDYTEYTEGNLFRVSVPSNWRELRGTNAVTFAPDGAYGDANGQGVLTHGMEIGLVGTETPNVRTATDEFIGLLAGNNPRLSRPSRYDTVSIAGRQGLHTVLSNVSEATGQQERIEIFTRLFGDGGLFYALGVAPRDSFSAYQATFRRIVGSIQLNEGDPALESASVSGLSGDTDDGGAEELEQYVADSNDDAADQPRVFIAREQERLMTSRKLLFHILPHEIRHWAQIDLAVRLAGLEPPGDHDLFYSRALK